MSFSEHAQILVCARDGSCPAAQRHAPLMRIHQIPFPFPEVVAATRLGHRGLHRDRGCNVTLPDPLDVERDLQWIAAGADRLPPARFVNAHRSAREDDGSPLRRFVTGQWPTAAGGAGCGIEQKAHCSDRSTPPQNPGSVSPLSHGSTSLESLGRWQLVEGRAEMQPSAARHVHTRDGPRRRVRRSRALQPAAVGMGRSAYGRRRPRFATSAVTWIDPAGKDCVWPTIVA